jgi:hypothetical protein
MRSRTLGLVLVSSLLSAIEPTAAQLTPINLGRNFFTDKSVLCRGSDAGLLNKQRIGDAAEDDPKARSLDAHQLFDLSFFP